MLSLRPQLPRFSARAANLHASPIREILSIIDKPEIISFAGGLPAPETFPELSLVNFPRAMMQYGPSEGEPDLRAQVAEDLNAIGLDCSKDQVVILSGSQQGIDLVSKLFIDPGSIVAVESPTYLMALEAFRFFGAQFETYHSQQIGVNGWFARRPSLLYTAPTYQNPTGRCYSTDERNELARTCEEQGLPLFEDDPYRDIAFEGCERKPVCSFIKRGPWIYQSSFSKCLAPGLRLGFLAASTDLVSYLVKLKQAADLHSSRISQWLVLELLRDKYRADRLARIVSTYKRKRDLFANALERQLGKSATWTIPSGGLFFWLRMIRPIDTRTILPEAIRRGVAFMPGEPFYLDPAGNAGALRLNFSYADEGMAEQGLATLAAILSSGY